MNHMKAKRAASAPFVQTTDAATQGMDFTGPKGAVSVEGKVVCPQLIKAPASGTDCLYYEMKVVEKWKTQERNSQGQTTTVTKTRDLQSVKMAAPFTVDDGSGPVKIDASQGGTFDNMKQSFNQTQGVGLLGGLVGKDLMFGSYKLSVSGTGSEYQVTESILPPQEKLYVIGKMVQQGVIGAPSWTSLILSAKTRDDFIGAAAKLAKLCFMIGGGATVVGGILAAIAARG